MYYHLSFVYWISLSTVLAEADEEWTCVLFHIWRSGVFDQRLSASHFSFTNDPHFCQNMSLDLAWVPAISSEMFFSTTASSVEHMADEAHSGDKVIYILRDVWRILPWQTDWQICRGIRRARMTYRNFVYGQIRSSHLEIVTELHIFQDLIPQSFLIFFCINAISKPMKKGLQTFASSLSMGWEL